MAGPRKRYLASNFTNFLGPHIPGKIVNANRIPVVGRGNPPRDKARNLRRQAEHGFVHFKEIHSALAGKPINSVHVLQIVSPKGVRRKYTYRKVADGDYQLIGKESITKQ